MPVSCTRIVPGRTYLRQGGGGGGVRGRTGLADARVGLVAQGVQRMRTARGRRTTSVRLASLTRHRTRLVSPWRWGRLGRPCRPAAPSPPPPAPPLAPFPSAPRPPAGICISAAGRPRAPPVVQEAPLGGLREPPPARLHHVGHAVAAQVGLRARRRRGPLPPAARAAGPAGARAAAGGELFVAAAAAAAAAAAVAAGIAAAAASVGAGPSVVVEPLRLQKPPRKLEPRPQRARRALLLVARAEVPHAAAGGVGRAGPGGQGRRCAAVGGLRARRALARGATGPPPPFL
jgi:hypothetical protein